MNRTARIEIVPTAVGREDGEVFAFDPHYLRLIASNGLTLAHSENYSSRSKARRATTSWLRAFDDVLTESVSGGEAVREVELP